MTTKHYTPTYPIVKTALPVKRYLIMLVFLLSAFVQAATAQDRTLTLDEAIKLGLDNSKTLKLSKSKVDEAVSQYNQVMDKVLPTASVSLAYNRAEIPANVLSFGTESLHLPKNADAFLGIASVNETIYAGHKFRYAQQSTKLLTDIARLDIAKDRNQITYDIIDSYYNLYKVIQSKKVIAQNLTSIDEQIHQSQRFFEQGLVTKNDVLRFQLQRSNVELTGIDLESNRKIINYNLNILLGLPESTQLTIAEIKEEPKAVAPLINYLDTAMSNRQELAQYELRGKYADTHIKSIEANTKPTVSASAAGYYVDANINPLPKSGNYITPLTIGITGAWKFDALWTNKNKVAEARIQRDQVDINKNITIDNIKTEINANYQNYLTALNKIKLLQTSIEQAGENNNILASKYKSNIASATDKADAETLLYQAQINLELAKADAGLAYYTLLKSTGKLNK